LKWKVLGKIEAPILFKGPLEAQHCKIAAPASNPSGSHRACHYYKNNLRPPDRWERPFYWVAGDTGLLVYKGINSRITKGKHQMVIRNHLSAWLLLFLCFAVPPSEASMLSQQYTSRWASPDFFPLETTLFRIGTVKNETGHDATFDMLSYLSEQTRQQLTKSGFKEDPSDNPTAIVIELRIHLYQEGSTLWEVSRELTDPRHEGAGFAESVHKA
jgi:hypothetical protein